jgi:heterotetrameric sarcosine oxidase delta subunit
MKIPCPLCGSRDRREFYYMGTEDYLTRSDDQASVEALDNQLFLRDNPAGPVRDLWYHETGCGSWMVVSRNTITHEIFGAELVSARKMGAK